MGKIWLKSTDPNNQCCGCENKTGPCSSCITCSGLVYQTVQSIWSGKFSSLNNSIRNVPAIDCEIVKSATDVATHGLIGIYTGINLIIQGEGISGLRNNAFQTTFTKNDVLNITIQSNTTSNSLPARFDRNTGVPLISPNYNKYYFYYNINSGSVINIYSQGGSTKIGEVIEGTFFGANPGTPLNEISSFGLVNNQYLPVKNEFGGSRYFTDTYYTFTGGTIRTTVGAGLRSVQTYFTNFSTPDTNAQPVIFNVLRETSDLFFSGEQQALRNAVGMVRENFDVNMGDRCWQCLFDITVGQWQWIPTTTNNFGDLELNNSNVYSAWENLASFVNGYEFENGNRYLGYEVFLTGDTSDWPQYRNGPNEVCDIGINNFETRCYPGYFRLSAAYSTTWPYDTFNNQMTNTMRIAMQSGVCVTILTSPGGIAPMPDSYQKAHGIEYSGTQTVVQNATFKKESNHLELYPIIFLQNSSGIDCPYELP